ncbi:hypothetical protein [Pedobacter cryoconitis]|uniref:Uncharacterized protein n=1 Tax=Pedobacter cryoconitis TaxID=188932 RepID=A0A7X0MIS7_9SPHI|nr:hypothetical protein [Pedobacter cryoconitis]MBB6500464.1 hypothetical protein [Pedobacter cryoconitis]
METKRQIKLNYTREFTIACKINNLKPIELLQYFINHVSFYAFIGGKIDVTYLWATTVCIDFKEEYGGEIIQVTIPEIQEISLKYIKKLTSLNLNEPFLSSTAAFQSILIMDEWSSEMLPFTDYEPEIMIFNGELLKLTFDFNLICRMNGSGIEELLQYFIDKVSLARERATNFHHFVKTDPSTAFLLLLVGHDESVRDRVLPQQEMYKKYGLRLLELDDEQNEEDNFENRMKNYDAFYQEWFSALNRISN